MGKKPLLLAFGTHGILSGNIPLDKKFFKRSAAPFIEAHAKSGRVLLCLEGVPAPFGVAKERIRALVSQKSSLGEDTVRELLGEIDRAMRDEGAYLEHRINLYVSEGKMPPGEDYPLWGLERVVSRINQNNNGRVSVVYEPSCAASFCAKQQFDVVEGELVSVFGTEEMTEVVASCIRANIRMMTLRDRLLAETLNGNQYDGFDALIVVRGGQHAPMTTMIDSTKYKIQIRQHARCDDFMDMATHESYDAPLDETRLMLYAQMETDFLIKLVELHAEASLRLKTAGLNFSKPGWLDTIIKTAMQSAVRQHPDIAQKLGIELPV